MQEQVGRALARHERSHAPHARSLHQTPASFEPSTTPLPRMRRIAARATETIANETSYCFNPHKASIQFILCAYPCKQAARVSTKWIPGAECRLSHRKPRLSLAARAGRRHCGDARGWKHWATRDDRTTCAAPTAFLLPAQRGEGGAKRRMRGGRCDARPAPPARWKTSGQSGKKPWNLTISARKAPLTRPAGTFSPRDARGEGSTVAMHGDGNTGRRVTTEQPAQRQQRSFSPRSGEKVARSAG
jgi:hypothetical protein